ncbi:MAG: hypothetical protein QE263_04805 [Vampirovibrionales bacterium]|nr:hypothetical protein [Vampirovibrionales bacterium]
MGIVRRAQRGVVAVLIAGTLVMLLIALGVALYTGVNAYIQGDLQHLSNSMALAGARSMYDDLETDPSISVTVDGITTTALPGKTAPQFSQAKAKDAANAVFDRVTKYHPILSNNFQTSIDKLIINEEEQSVLVVLTGVIPTPFLSFMGINELDLEAKSKALYSQVNGLTTPIRINTQGVDAQGEPDPKSPYAQAINLPLPLLDGYGPDLFMDTGLAASGGYHGVRIELCTVEDATLKCYDMGKAARVYNNQGAIRPIMNKAGGEIGRVLYGKIFIDMAYLNFNKATAIRISDDGVHDALTGTDGLGKSTGRILELVPADTQIGSIRLLHYAALCREADCTRPSGLLPAPDLY